MSVTSNNDMVTCMYCGKQVSNTTEAIIEHIIICEKRPEMQLLAKMKLLEDTGDHLLQTIRAVVKALTDMEGMRSKSWEIYHLSKKKWEEAKQITPEEIAEIMQREPKEPENEQEEKEEENS